MCQYTLENCVTYTVKCKRCYIPDKGKSKIITDQLKSIENVAWKKDEKFFHKKNVNVFIQKKNANNMDEVNRVDIHIHERQELSILNVRTSKTPTFSMIDQCRNFAYFHRKIGTNPQKYRR